MKKGIMVTVDEDLPKQAKEKGMNISEIANKSIKEAVTDITNVNIKALGKCEFCGKEDRKATRDDLYGLTWLWPDERWICNSCLKNQRTQ